MKTENPVMWTSVHQQERRRSRKFLIWSNLTLFIICIFLFLGWFGASHPQIEQNNLKQQVSHYKKKLEILSILRTKGISLSQGLDIADSLIVQSKKNGVPLELGIAIMQRESEYSVIAISNAKAIGLMQIMPKTFDDYNKNLHLGFSRSAAFDPVINIQISMLHLKDLIAENRPKAKSENELWKRVLNAYSSNAKGYPEAIRKSQKELEGRFKNASSTS